MLSVTTLTGYKRKGSSPAKPPDPPPQRPTSPPIVEEPTRQAIPEPASTRPTPPSIPDPPSPAARELPKRDAPKPPPVVKTAPPAAPEAPAEREDPPGGPRCDAPTWRRFVHGLGHGERAGPLRAAFAVARFLSNEGDRLQLGFQSKLTLKHADRALTDTRLIEALTTAFDGPIELELSHVADGRGARTLQEEIERIRREKTAALSAEARKHSAVGVITEAFPGAAIRSVKPPRIDEVHDVR